jgi:hypothetical protein
MLEAGLVGFILLQFMTVRLAASIVVLILVGMMTLYLILETE